MWIAVQAQRPDDPWDTPVQNQGFFYARLVSMASNEVRQMRIRRGFWRSPAEQSARAAMNRNDVIKPLAFGPSLTTKRHIW